MATCPDCAPFRAHHFENWLDDILALWFYPLLDPLTPRFLVARVNDRAITDVLVALRIVRRERDFPLEKVNPIAATFIKRGRARGLSFEALRGPFGYLTFFRMSARGADGRDRLREIDRLPGAAQNTFIADDKWVVKRELAKLGYPVAPGRAFSLLSRRAAARYAAGTLGFPVVVKPRRGSLSQHMFIVKDAGELRAALRRVVRYAPAFIIEKFVPDATLYRMTVVDGAAGDGKIFVVKRLPPSATGDGKSTLAMLVKKMGIDPRNVDHALLTGQGAAPGTVIAKGKKILLHHKAIMALRSEIVPVPAREIHPTILAMCRDIAKRFRLPLVGIDILMQDHRRPLAGQNTAILELNTLPNITMHTFTSNGREENAVADALVDLALANS